MTPGQDTGGVVPHSVSGAVAALPGLARSAAAAWWRTASWSAGATARAGSTVVRAATSGRPPGAALDELAAETMDYVRRVLGVLPPDGVPDSATRSAGDAVPMSSVIADRVKRAPGGPAEHASAASLPEMFNALLDASTDVSFQEETHPAYVRLLQELSPDEARILRLFAQKGPQPALDVRTAGTFGFGSKLVAPGITMIALHAGCSDVARVLGYLGNLNRLGLIWFSNEMVGDVNSYALLEAQPEAMDVVHELGGKSKARIVLRSIELTAFGKNLCALCDLMGAEELSARASDGEVT